MSGVTDGSTWAMGGNRRLLESSDRVSGEGSWLFERGRGRA
jgi:hypothetical protein